MKEYEVRTIVRSVSSQNAADFLHAHDLGTLFVIDLSDPLKQESRFVWTQGGYKFVDATCKAEREHTCGTDATPQPCSVEGCDAPSLNEQMFGPAEAAERDLLELGECPTCGQEVSI